jgi:hypothetical protein
MSSLWSVELRDGLSNTIISMTMDGSCFFQAVDKIWLHYSFSAEVYNMDG